MPGKPDINNEYSHPVQGIFLFLRNPKAFSELDDSLRQISFQNILEVFQLTAITVILAYFANVAVTLILGLFPLGIRESYEVPQAIIGNPWYVVALLLLFVAPFYEEFSFRYFYNTKHDFLLSASFGLFFFLTVITFLNYFFVPDPENTSSLITGLYNVILLLSILIIFSFLFQPLLRPIEWFIREHFSVVVWASVTAFALVHIGNFRLEPAAYVFLPFLVIAQFIAGLMFAYVRCRYSLWLSILAHAFYNLAMGMVVILMLFFQIESTKIIDTIELLNAGKIFQIDQVVYLPVSLTTAYFGFLLVIAIRFIWASLQTKTSPIHD